MYILPVNNGDIILDLLEQVARKFNDANLMIQFNHAAARYRIEKQREQEALIKTITERVLQQISVSADTSAAVMKIKELEDAINRLGGKK